MESGKVVRQAGSLSPLPRQRRRANSATFEESQHVEKCVHISLSPKKVKFCIVCVVYERLRVFWLSARFFKFCVDGVRLQQSCACCFLSVVELCRQLQTRNRTNISTFPVSKSRRVRKIAGWRPLPIQLVAWLKMSAPMGLLCV